ncbi:MAG TPA: Ku protein [Microthrixaceae bacterium]|nr:Ku protein [Microthrixaceae bacterium]
MRGVWSGSITFGLVNVSVKALTATRDHDIHFHQLERDTGSRIGYQKISKATGEPVDPENIQLGYELSKGRYVTLERGEVDELRPASGRTIDVTDFVQLDSIDPVFFENTYWLAPTDEAATRAYVLLAAAMIERGRVGIGTVVMRNKQYLAAIRPISGVLAMSTMRFADEVLQADDIDEIPTEAEAPKSSELALATQIVDALASEWQPERYEDTFTRELKALLQAKGDGGAVVESPSEVAPEGAMVVDLMEALQASVAAAKNAGSGPRKSA